MTLRRDPALPTMKKTWATMSVSEKAKGFEKRMEFHEVRQQNADLIISNVEEHGAKEHEAAPREKDASKRAEQQAGFHKKISKKLSHLAGDFKKSEEQHLLDREANSELHAVLDNSKYNLESAATEPLDDSFHYSPTSVASNIEVAPPALTHDEAQKLTEQGMDLATESVCQSGPISTTGGDFQPEQRFSRRTAFIGTKSKIAGLSRVTKPKQTQRATTQRYQSPKPRRIPEITFDRLSQHKHHTIIEDSKDREKRYVLWCTAHKFRAGQKSGRRTLTDPVKSGLSHLRQRHSMELQKEHVIPVMGYLVRECTVEQMKRNNDDLKIAVRDQTLDYASSSEEGLSLNDAELVDGDDDLRGSSLQATDPGNDSNVQAMDIAEQAQTRATTAHDAGELEVNEANDNINCASEPIHGHGSEIYEDAPAYDETCRHQSSDGSDQYLPLLDPQTIFPQHIAPISSMSNPVNADVSFESTISRANAGVLGDILDVPTNRDNIQAMHQLDIRTGAGMKTRPGRAGVNSVSLESQPTPCAPSHRSVYSGGIGNRHLSASTGFPANHTMLDSLPTYGNMESSDYPDLSGTFDSHEFQ